MNRLSARQICALTLFGILSPLAVSSQTSNTLTQLTSELAALGDAYQTSGDSGQQAQLADRLAKVARARRAHISKLIETDPAAALRTALSKHHRDQLPANLRPLVENETETAGVLEMAYEDGAQGSVLQHVLKVGNRRLFLHFAKTPKGLTSGSRVRVKGLEMGNLLALGGSGSVETLELGTNANTFGPQKTMVLLVNFVDSPVQPYDVAYAQGVMSQVNDFIKESSYQQTSIQADVYNWLTIDMSVTVCNTTTLTDKARDAAIAAGIPVFTYPRWVFAFPVNACGFWGKGTVGGISPPGEPSSLAFINGLLERKVVSHEIGHNFGLQHAHAIGCSDGATGITPNPNCATFDYGDPIDNMANAPGYWNAFNREHVGWLNNVGFPPITAVPSPGGVYWIDAYENPGNNPKALAIPRAGGSFFYVESRQATGADAFLANNPSALHGVFIRTGTPGLNNTSVLYDTTPATMYNFSDAALTIGKTFTDPLNGISITTLSADPSGASVMVNFGPVPCTHLPALVSLTGPGTPIVPGGVTTFSVSVTNVNTQACGSSTFMLAGTAPSGWTADVANASVTLSPGQTTTTTLQVIASGSASGGVYPVSTVATESGTPANVGSGAADVQVLGICVPGSPLIEISPSSAAIAPGAMIGLTVTLTNRNNADCGSSTFTLFAGVSAGWGGTLNDSALTAGPGASTSTTLTVTAPMSATGGSHPVSVIGVQNGNPANGGAGSATLVVPTPCIRMSPLVALSPLQTSLNPGAATDLTLTVTNRNNSVCGSSTFSLGAVVPSGWTGTLDDAALTIGAGANQSTTMHVLTPGSAAAQSFGVSASASDNSAPGNNGSGSANITVLAKLTVTLTTDKASYKRGVTAVLNAVVAQNGAPVPSTTVAFSVTLPDQRVVTTSARSDSTGKAKAKFQIKSNYPLGQYSVSAIVSKNGLTGSATTTFTVTP